MTEIAQIQANLVSITGGSFEMGCKDYPREQPVHSVTLADFQLSKYQVTQGQWKAVMGSNPSEFQISDAHPVDSVSWEMAAEFLRALRQQTGIAYRLPTEAEWEFAARGGTLSKGYKFAGSDNLADVAWYNGNAGFKTQAVGGKTPNELGLYDLCGNVWEWCAEIVPYDYAQPDRIASSDELQNSNDRMLRGGSYINYAVFCRSTYRWEDRPDNVENYIGLRLALS